jgi:hypothetical protein
MATRRQSVRSSDTQSGLNSGVHSERWQAKPKHLGVWSDGHAYTLAPRQTRQKSLSDDVRAIRAKLRGARIIANAQVNAEALKASVAVKLTVSSSVPPDVQTNFDV